MQCIDNTINHGHTYVIISMSTMHKHSASLFRVVIMFVCEILSAPAAVMCLASCNIIRYTSIIHALNIDRLYS